jgi:hypothetical protein
MTSERYVAAGPPTRHRKTKEWTFDQIDPALDFHPNVSPEEMRAYSPSGGSDLKVCSSARRIWREFRQRQPMLAH